jgi:hypothetical protein
VERTASREVQFPSIGDFGRLGVWPVVAVACPEWSSASIGEKKGGVTPRRQSARRRLTIDFKAEDL